jgi:hypothetical protein
MLEMGIAEDVDIFGLRLAPLLANFEVDAINWPR